MGLFKNLFGKKPEPEKQPTSRPFTPATLPPVKGQPTGSAPVDPSKDPNMIKVFDGYGREMFITREVWRTKVLPGTIEANWNNADQLAGVIIGSLNDGFFADVLEAAEHLCQIDSDPVRSTCIYGILLMKNNRLDQAERVFRDHIKKHGENGSVLTNLAKVYSARNEHQKAEEILWHGLELDPNQDNGFAWYQAIYRERGGNQAGDAAMQRVAALPGSWRPQLWQAREALKSRNLDGALALYRESLARVKKPIPSDLLRQISGDLGNAGHLPEILQLTEPHFDPALHGLQVGNNLIKAHMDLGQFDNARRILDQLYALKRLDWQKSLSFWDTEIAKAGVAANSAMLDQKKPLKMAMLSIDGPVWLAPDSPAAELFPAKTPDGLAVCFLAGTAEKATNSKRIEHQIADDSGRMSRALPLFFAEQIDFLTRARVQTLVPWIAEEIGGFVLSSANWSDEDAANQARQSQVKNDYVVTTHLKTQTEPWTIELHLVRTIDSKNLSHLSTTLVRNKPEETVFQLVRELLGLIAHHAGVETQAPAPLYQVPEGANFPYYLLRLEQLLAVRCGSLKGVQSNFLNGPREIIDGNIQQCLTSPQNVPARLLLAQTLLAMKKVRPDIMPEFKDKLALLQKEKPLPEPAQSVVQRMLNEALAA
jgi:tetratricopeptide (TPR) repeat protein